VIPPITNMHDSGIKQVHSLTTETFAHQVTLPGLASCCLNCINCALIYIGNVVCLVGRCHFTTEHLAAEYWLTNLLAIKRKKSQ